MNRLIISVPILIAFITLFLLESIIDSTLSHHSAMANDNAETENEAQPFEESVEQTYALTTTLYPDTSATMVYTSDGGTLINLYFPPHATDITRTMALITRTTVPRPGYMIGEFAFSLTSIGNGVYDGYFVNFFAPVSLTIRYDDSFIPIGISETEAQMDYVQWTGWQPIENTCYPPQLFQYDEENNVISGLICRPALYAYLGTHSQYFPVVVNEFASPTWEQIGFSGQQVTDLYLDPFSPNHLFASIYATGLFETVDGGANWVQQPIFARINDIHPHPNISSTIYLATWSTYGIYWTQNAGQSWEPIPGWKSLSPTLYSITVSPISPTLMLAGAGSWEGKGGEIFKTVNSGQRWYTVSPTHTNALVYAFDPTSSTTIYAGTLHAGIMKSVNNGDSWIAANDGLPTSISGTHEIQALAFHPNFPDKLYAATSLGLYLRNEHTGDWQSIWQGDANTFVFQGDSTVYLGTSSGIFVSHNNGLSWQSLGQCESGVVINHLALDPFNSNILWAATNNGIWQCNF